MVLICQFPFLGMLLQNDGSRTSTRGYKKQTDTSLAVTTFVMPFKHQKSATVVRRRLADLKKNKCGQGVRPVFTSRTLEDESRIQDTRQKLLNQQCVVYKFECGQVRLTMLGIPAVTCTNV